EELQARFLQFHAQGDREAGAEDARKHGQDQVEGADVLVVGREQPAADEARPVIRLGAGDIRHRFLPFGSGRPVGFGSAAALSYSRSSRWRTRPGLLLLLDQSVTITSIAMSWDWG